MAGLNMLRRLVTVLTLVLICGFVVMIVAFVTRFPDPPQTNSALTLPDHIALPDGVEASAFTHGGDWLAVVAQNTIYIFVTETGALQQVVQIDTRAP